MIASYLAGYKSAYDSFERDLNRQPAFDPISFYAEIKGIEGNTFLVDGIEQNDAKYRGEFAFSVYGETKLDWKGTTINVSDF